MGTASHTSINVPQLFLIVKRGEERIIATEIAVLLNLVLPALGLRSQLLCQISWTTQVFSPSDLHLLPPGAPLQAATTHIAKHCPCLGWGGKTTPIESCLYIAMKMNKIQLRAPFVLYGSVYMKLRLRCERALCGAFQGLLVILHFLTLVLTVWVGLVII